MVLTLLICLLSGIPTGATTPPCEGDCCTWDNYVAGDADGVELRVGDVNSVAECVDLALRACPDANAVTMRNTDTWTRSCFCERGANSRADPTIYASCFLSLNKTCEGDCCAMEEFSPGDATGDTAAYDEEKLGRVGSIGECMALAKVNCPNLVAITLEDTDVWPRFCWCEEGATRRKDVVGYHKSCFIGLEKTCVGECCSWDNFLPGDARGSEKNLGRVGSTAECMALAKINCPNLNAITMENVDDWPRLCFCEEGADHRDESFVNYKTCFISPAPSPSSVTCVGECCRNADFITGDARGNERNLGEVNSIGECTQRVWSECPLANAVTMEKKEGWPRTCYCEAETERIVASEHYVACMFETTTTTASSSTSTSTVSTSTISMTTFTESTSSSTASTTSLTATSTATATSSTMSSVSSTTSRTTATTSSTATATFSSTTSTVSTSSETSVTSTVSTIATATASTTSTASSTTSVTSSTVSTAVTATLTVSTTVTSSATSTVTTSTASSSAPAPTSIAATTAELLAGAVSSTRSATELVTTVSSASEATAALSSDAATSTTGRSATELATTVLSLGRSGVELTTAQSAMNMATTASPVGLSSLSSSKVASSATHMTTPLPLFSTTLQTTSARAAGEAETVASTTMPTGSAAGVMRGTTAESSAPTKPSSSTSAAILGAAGPSPTPADAFPASIPGHSSTASTTATTTVSPTTTSTGLGGPTYTTSASNTQTEAPALAKARAVAQAVDMGVAALFGANATNITLNTDAGQLTVIDLSADSASSGSSRGASFTSPQGNTVWLPSSLLRTLPDRAVLAILAIDASPSSDDTPGTFDGLATLATKTLDISIRDGNGQPIKVSFEDPLLFKLPGSEESPGAKCVYLDTESPAGPVWSTRGVRRASNVEVEEAGEMPGGVWCFTEHLSIFAAIIQAVLGCTNFELLSPEAMCAVTEHEGWYKAGSAIIVFGLLSLMFLALLLGSIREWWALRLGRTHERGKRVSLCKTFLTLGPQLIKHRYTVFLVYAKDLFHCVRTGREKLKNASLTASVQRFLAVRSGISVACVAGHCWNGGGWLESKASLPHTVLCRKLEFHAGTAERVIEEDIFSRGFLGLLRRFTMTALAIHPLLDAMRVGAGSLSIKKRTLLQAAGLCGVLATNSLIFNFSGGLRSWEADMQCPIPKKSQLFIFVASLVSILINVIPNAFLLDLAKQVHGRPLWNVAFYLLTLSFLAFALLLIVVALSNLNPKDQAAWQGSLRWSMTFKLLGMPLAQTLRHMLMLEHFLRDDQKCKHSQTFRVFMGLSHSNEIQLSLDEEESAKRMARHVISAGELVKFAALLGKQVMPEFDPEISTSDDVVLRAVAPLCMRQPGSEGFLVTAEVVEVRGLQQLPGPLTCSILHLGNLSNHERPCLFEMHSNPAEPLTNDGLCCHFGLETTMQGLLPDHALAFVVSATGNKLGIAWLSLDELLSCGGQWAGELTLLAAEQEQGSPWSSPPEAAAVPATSIRASKGRCGSEELLPGTAWITVKVCLPRSPDAAVAGGGGQLQEPQRGFCDALQDGHQPPQRMVVHSKQGKFAHLLATVLTDALGQKEAYKAVKTLIADGDFAKLHEMLREAGCDGMRYWIDMFSVNPSEHRQGQVDGGKNWHEGFLASWPTILRTMKKASCRKMVMDIEDRKVVKSPSPLQQILVLDQDCHFFREMGCIAELMLAKSMRVRQRLVLHPEHLHGGSLGQELSQLSMELGQFWNSKDRKYVAPYLDNRQAAYDAVRELVVASVKEQRDDSESTWQELNMADLSANVFASAIGTRDQSGDGAAPVGDDLEVEVEA